MSLHPVFLDPSGRRGRAVRSALFLAAALAVLLAGSLLIGVLNPPLVEPLPMAAAVPLAPGTGSAPTASVALSATALPAAPSSVLPTAVTASALSALATPSCAARALGPTGGPPPCATMLTPRTVGVPSDDPIVAAFAVQWDLSSREALRRAGPQLDWLIVEGAFIGREETGALSINLDPDLLALASELGVDVHLMLTNFGTTRFDSTLVSDVVGTASRRAAAVQALVRAVRSDRLSGVTLDFELVPDALQPRVLQFIAELRVALQPLGAVISAAIPIGEDDNYPLRAYGEALDYLIPMLYDEHADEGAPGPIAGASWFAERLDAVLTEVPASKVIVGLGQYGYHWRSDREVAATVSVSEAMALGRILPGAQRLDESTRNPTASWRDGNGVIHSVWHLDATTAYNQIRAAATTGTAGLAFWRLGGEDVTLWKVLGRRGLIAEPSALRDLPANGVSVITGDGEILAVDRREGVGERRIDVDATGYVHSAPVIRPPGGYVVARAGVASRRVALTFDDGPDGEFTGAILDTLRSRQAQASFFVVGQQVQRYPALTRRIAFEGHEIGNHSWSHANLGLLSESAVRRELASTGRVIEAVTGRRPMLFRPPYIGDAHPSTADQLRPMAIANSLGYRVAALEVDPQDWYTKDPIVIVNNTLRLLEQRGGHIILLHDAGGDRSPTIAAVGPLIDSLRARGYEPTTVAGLLDVDPLAGTPMAPDQEAAERWLNRLALTIGSAVQRLLVAVFLVALVLGLLRQLVIGTLAAWQRFAPRYARRAGDDQFTPTVSVLIPGYNEGRVIARTVRSVLAQQYADFDVVVIDDGSSDDTRAQAESASDDPRLRVLHQANAGKAAALNRGIASARGDIIVVIDADTLLVPDAIHHLVRPLADQRVGAVAGNAKVGNRVNLVTRWQAVEYVTSQNLDRRAFVMLNCITVVPGAIGAWRSSAVREAGGFRSDTMAEDQDLTLTLLQLGHRVALADRAIALTEAPETFSALLTQRFRWSFGTLQCAWKHRGALFNRQAGALGLVGLPNVWLFQLLFPLLAPAADLALVVTLLRLAAEAPMIGLHAAWAHAAPVVGIYGLFLVVDTMTALIGVAFERGERLSQALLVPLQRIVYRQVLYVALVKAIRVALKGWAPAWGKLERTGRVQDGPPPVPVVVNVTPLPVRSHVGEERRQRVS